MKNTLVKLLIAGTLATGFVGCESSDDPEPVEQNQGLTFRLHLPAYSDQTLTNVPVANTAPYVGDGVDYGPFVDFSTAEERAGYKDRNKPKGSDDDHQGRDY